LKRDIKPFTDGLAVVDGINPVCYKWNGLWGKRHDDLDNVGVIAQELAAVAPYAVGKVKGKLYAAGPDGDIAYVHNEALIYVLINAVAELNVRLERLAKEGIPS
jgi:hypothetical protein